MTIKAAVTFTFKNYFLVQVFKKSFRSKDQFPSKLCHFIDVKNTATFENV